MFDPESFITDRLHKIDASGIRRVFDLAASLKDPANLSIGQPDFDVPQHLKDAAIKAIQEGHNRYTVTQGTKALIDKINATITSEFPLWKDNAGTGGKPNFGTLVTSGVSGGLLLALLTCVQPGDEVIIPDPYFVMYRHLVTLAGGTPIYVDTYPDFQLTAERVIPHLTKRTKLLLFNTPSNPTGVVATSKICEQLAKLAEERNFLLLSDEIYDEFCYEKIERPAGSGQKRCPSPATYSNNLLLLRGFSKTYAMTGWRLGYAVGPKAIIDEMTKLQQYSFVCAPSMTQFAGVAALDADMTSYVEAYRLKRELVAKRLGPKYRLTLPGGAFYAFPEVPPRLGLSATQFVEKAIAKNLLIIPGSVFSSRDTHFRISYACNEAMLNRGLDILLELAD
jgi:aspartate/methionine/tyrosine aminotransferase